MSDFFSSFWSYYVGIITVVSILLCGWLLWIMSRAPKSTGAARDESGVETTGHVWDEDLRELNNPLPRWWAWLFVITIVFGLAYLVAYPGLGSYAGVLGWTQSAQHGREVQAAQQAAAPVYARFENLPTEQLAASSDAMAIGERLFMNNCAQCHGSDARGSKGFPNLADKDWLYGGTPEKIIESIEQGRAGGMPPMAAAVGSNEDVARVAHYVLSLSGGGDPLKAALGREKFQAVCAACHGADGKGNHALGAPNLADTIWLHGYGTESVIETITKGRNGVMPQHADKLTPAQLRILAAYVWQLSNPVSATSTAAVAGSAVATR